MNNWPKNIDFADMIGDQELVWKTEKWVESESSEEPARGGF